MNPVLRMLCDSHNWRPDTMSGITGWHSRFWLSQICTLSLNLSFSGFFRFRFVFVFSIPRIDRLSFVRKACFYVAKRVKFRFLSVLSPTPHLSAWFLLLWVSRVHHWTPARDATPLSWQSAPTICGAASVSVSRQLPSCAAHFCHFKSFRRRQLSE